MADPIGWILSAILGLVAVADLAGTWQFDCRRTGSDDPGPTVIVKFEQDNERLSGSCLVKETGSKFTLTGRLDGDQVAWECLDDREGTATFKGKLEGPEISGTWETAPYVAEGTFRGTKQ